MEDREIYRCNYGAELETARLCHGETDLAICLPVGIWNTELAHATSAYIVELRLQLQAYLAQDAGFAASHIVYQPHINAPSIAEDMAQAAALAGVGPMASVAGAFAQAVGVFLAGYSSEVIVENGGDIYMATSKDRIVGVYAGPNNPYTGQLGLIIRAAQQPLGICTSSGTIGSSFSYGKADAAVVLAANTLYADAAATALANRVQSSQDVGAAIEFIATLPGIKGALAICKDVMAAWGEVELCR
ncbi:MAG: UPF0280 family protein [Firmicutes bacterium]|nr:UPF0280 family protein [Bacillota bacterium]